MTSTTVSSVTFTRPFVLPGMDHPHAPGTFQVVVESETLDVWWPAYKNTTMIMLTGNGATEAWTVVQGDLDAALAADRPAQD